MWMILLLFLLPLLYLFGWLVAPFLFLAGRNLNLAEHIRLDYGVVGEYLFFMLITTLVILSWNKSKWFFWLGLLPVLCIGAYLGRWR